MTDEFGREPNPRAETPDHDMDCSESRDHNDCVDPREEEFGDTVTVAFNVHDKARRRVFVDCAVTRKLRNLNIDVECKEEQQPQEQDTVDVCIAEQEWKLGDVCMVEQLASLAHSYTDNWGTSALKVEPATIIELPSFGNGNRVGVCLHDSLLGVDEVAMYVSSDGRVSIAQVYPTEECTVAKYFTCTK